MKLTVAAVSALILPPGKREHFVWDADLPGFGVRLRGGKKRWVVQYRVGHQQRRESLGDTRTASASLKRSWASTLPPNERPRWRSASPLPWRLSAISMRDAT